MTQEPTTQPDEQQPVDATDPSEIAGEAGEGTDHEQFRGDAVADDDDGDDEVDANLATLEDDDDEDDDGGEATAG